MSKPRPDQPPAPASASHAPEEGPPAPRRRAALYLWEHDTPEATAAAMKALAAHAKGRRASR